MDVLGSWCICHVKTDPSASNSARATSLMSRGSPNVDERATLVSQWRDQSTNKYISEWALRRDLLPLEDLLRPRTVRLPVRPLRQPRRPIPPPPPALIIASLIIPTIRTHTKSIKLKIKREGIMITRMRATVAMSDAAASYPRPGPTTSGRGDCSNEHP